MSKFWFGWVTGFWTVLVMEITGVGDKRLEDLGWEIAPIGVVIIVVFLGMKWVASKCASDRDGKS